MGAIPYSPEITKFIGRQIMSLQLLPLEIQLRILELCLTTDNPIINYPAGSSYETLFETTAEGECHGQEDLRMAMLSTCLTYRTEGLKIVAQQNRFLFTRCESYPCLLHSEQILKHSIFRHIKHLEFRLVTKSIRHSAEQLQSAVFVLEKVQWRFPMLQNLDLDFVHQAYTSGVGEPDWAQARTEMQEAVEEARVFQIDQTSASNVPRRLAKVTVTGLRNDNVGHLVVRLASMLLGPDGTLGSGVARYVGNYVRILPRWGLPLYNRQAKLHAVSNMAIEWLDAGNVDS